MNRSLLVVALAISCTPSVVFNQTAATRAAEPNNARPAEPSNRYTHTSWTTEDGLPENSVTALVQTRDGYLWLGTFGGLARFDGVKFTVFETANSPGLGGNRITYLYEDRAGGLWVGFESGGLSRYSQGTFTSFTSKDGLPDSRVVLLAEDRQGTLWATTARGVARLSGGRFVTDPWLFGLPNANTFYYLQARDGNVWLGPTRGLTRSSHGALTTDLPRPSFIAAAKDGSVWTFNPDRGFDRFHAGAWTNYPLESDVKRYLTPGASAFEGREETICVLTAEGLGRFKNGTLISFARIKGLPEWRVAMEDREGNLWIGSNGLGLHRFKEATVISYAAAEGLSDDMFLSVIDDGAGGLWLGGGTLFPRGRSRLYHYRDGVFTASSFSGTAWALRLDRDGGLWIGEYGSLHRLKDGRITKFPMFEGTPVVALYEDRQGAMWIGTLGGHLSQSPGGMFRYKNGTFTPFRTTDGLVHKNVRVINQDRHGALWIGTEGGLSHFHDGKFTNYTTANGLSNNFVLDIYEDAAGTVWLATYGGGLTRFKEGKLAGITSREGLFDNFVARILEDDRGNFWMSSNRGIFRAARDDLNAVADGRLRSVTSVRYGVPDGMRTSECSAGGQPAGWKARDGKLWFATLRGMAVIDPAIGNDTPPPVAIEQILIDKQPLDPAEEMRAPAGNGDLEIHYTGLSLASPERVQFKYRLEGYDSTWIEAGMRRLAFYTRIPPGHYTFRVMAGTSDGIWNTSGAAIQFYVRPHFYQTRAFYGAVLAGLIGALSLLYRRRVSALRQSHAQQQAFSRELIASQERERQRIAAELHDSLGQNLLIVKNRAVLGALATADDSAPREQFDEINATVSQSIEEVRQIAYDLRPYHLDRLGLTQAIEDMVERIAAASHIGFSTRIEPLDGLFPKEAEISVFRVVQESVNNVVKHSGATEARVELVRSERRVHITVSDNGRGFPGHHAADASHPCGFGLAGMAERVTMLGGTRTIQSSPGQGTTLSVNLPLPNGSTP